MKINEDLLIGDTNTKLSQVKTNQDNILKEGSRGTLMRISNELTYTDSNPWTFHTVPMEREWEWYGNGYIIDDGNGSSMSIGEGVSLVEVSGQISLLYSSVNSALEVGINKNGSSTGIIGYYYRTGDAGGYGTETYIIPPQQIRVQKGDSFTMSYCYAAGGTTKVYAQPGRPATSFTIKVIA